MLGLVLCGAGSWAPCRAQPGLVGVNVNGLQNLDPASQREIVRQLAQAGVRAVRTSLRDDSKNIALARLLQDNRIGLVLVLDPRYRPGTVPRPADAARHLRAAAPLSAADPEASRAAFQAQFDRLDAAGVRLAGIEFSNEINWTDFNGDFPIPGEGRAFTLQDLQRDAGGQRVAAGLLQYLEVLAVLRRVRDHSRLDRQTPLISAGMAELSDPAWLRRLRVDGVTIPATYAFLRAHGLDELVDGYGVHFYPREMAPGDPAAGARQHEILKTTVFAPGNAKPYWLTEWGIGSQAANSGGDQARTRAVSEMRAAFAPLFRQGRLAGIFW